MSQTADSAGALFRAGRLDAAIEAANMAVRRAPGALGERILLAELLLFAGNLERCDRILDAAVHTDPGAAAVIAEFRQLLRAEAARRQMKREGRLPEFLEAPSAALRAALAAAVALRAGDAAEAARQAAAAEAARPRVAGSLGPPSAEVRFDDFRDADDLCAGFFEVLTVTGKYYWIPTERVVSLVFQPPRRPRDLVWRRARIATAGGPDGEVYLPAIYDAPDAGLDDAFRLGRATDWRAEDGGPVRGVGQRVFLIGEEARGIMELTAVRFEPAAPA
jgi:type VI secretion system protein ImpE